MSGSCQEITKVFKRFENRYELPFKSRQGKIKITTKSINSADFQRIEKKDLRHWRKSQASQTYQEDWKTTEHIKRNSLKFYYQRGFAGFLPFSKHVLLWLPSWYHYVLSPRVWQQLISRTNSSLQLRLETGTDRLYRCWWCCCSWSYLRPLHQILVALSLHLPVPLQV